VISEDQLGEYLLEYKFHIDCLEQEFQIRRQRNICYTHAAFARDLNLSRGALSEILSGRRNLSYKNCQKFCRTFSWSQQKKIEFLYNVAKASIELGPKRIHPEFKRILADEESLLCEPKKIKQKDFNLISQWFYVAILEMTFTGDLTKSDSDNIASRLGMKIQSVKTAINKLLGFGYLIEVDGVLRKTNKKLTLSDTDLTSKILIKHQSQILRIARSKLKSAPIDERNNSSIAMAIDPKNIPLVKKEIRLFMHKMSELLENGKQKKVYQLNVNLFSLEV
jgi:uncharacterized protein (TIGR02147 family)